MTVFELFFATLLVEIIIAVALTLIALHDFDEDEFIIFKYKGKTYKIKGEW